MDRKAEFNRYMIAIANGNGAIEEDITPEVKKVFVQQARWSYRQIRKLFDDVYGNLERWLACKPCVYKNPITGRLIEIQIGDDHEALYYFMEYCRRLQKGEHISQDFFLKVALQISRSQNQ